MKNKPGLLCRGLMEKTFPQEEIRTMSFKWLSVIASCTVLCCLVASVGIAAEPAKTPPDNEQLIAFARNTMVLSGDVFVSGSPAVQAIAGKLAQAFMAKQQQLKIEIKPSSAAAGLKAVEDGSVNVGMLARQMSEAELKSYPDLMVYNIAANGIAFIVNPTIGVTALTTDQIVGIFSGKITKWSQVGGVDKPITVIIREPEADSRITFENALLSGGKVKLVKGAVLQAAEDAVRAQVAADPNAIGYISLSVVDESVKAVSINNVEPTMANVSSSTYPVVFPISLVTKDAPNDLVRSWLIFILGPEGQELIEKEGYSKID